MCDLKGFEKALNKARSLNSLYNRERRPSQRAYWICADGLWIVEIITRDMLGYETTTIENMVE